MRLSRGAFREFRAAGKAGGQAPREYASAAERISRRSSASLRSVKSLSLASSTSALRRKAFRSSDVASAAIERGQSISADE
jgi:hypothetical protein